MRGGWCHTGDIGFLDDQGYLHISGRKKNMIKSGGISVFPEEIEDTLRKHPDVADAAVIGFKSQEWGEAVKAFVVLNSRRRMQRRRPYSILQRISGELQSTQIRRVCFQLTAHRPRQNRPRPTGGPESNRLIVRSIYGPTYMEFFYERFCS